MVSLTSLWLPIVLSAIIAFLASFVVHMVLPFHRKDFRKFSNEDELLEALRRLNIPPGDYIAPHMGGPEGMKDKVLQEKFLRGPVFTATFMPPGPISMGPQLAQWFGFCLIVSLFAGYIASRSVPAGSEYLRVCQMASTTAFLGYTMARCADAIWFKRSVATQVRATIDGLLYALLTGGVFGWLWPKLVQ